MALMATENRENDKKLYIKEPFFVDRPFLRYICTFLQQKVHGFFFLALLRKGKIVLMLRKTIASIFGPFSIQN